MNKIITVVALLGLLFSCDSMAKGKQDDCTIKMRMEMKAWIKKSTMFSDDAITAYTMEEETKALSKLKGSLSDIEFDKCSGEWVPYAITLKGQIDSYFDAQDKLIELAKKWEEADKTERPNMLEKKSKYYKDLGFQKGHAHGEIFVLSVDLVNELDIKAKFSGGRN